MRTIRLFDRSGRFLARVGVAELPQVVAERRAADGWAIADDSSFWEPTQAVLARAQLRPSARAPERLSA